MPFLHSFHHSFLSWVPLPPWMAQEARPRGQGCLSGVSHWWSGRAGSGAQGRCPMGVLDVVKPLCRALVTFPTCLSGSPTARQTRCMAKCLPTSPRASTMRISSATPSSAPSGKWSVGRGWGLGTLCLPWQPGLVALSGGEARPRRHITQSVKSLGTPSGW